MDLLHQSAYKILDTDPSQKSQLPRDLQELLETLEKTRFTSPSEVKCQHCGGNTIYHCHKKCTDPTEKYGYKIHCVSNHYHKENWFVCEDCSAFHLRCPRCPNIQLCRFLGFEGIFCGPYLYKWKIRLPPLEILQQKYGCKDDAIQQYIEYRQLHHHISVTSMEFLDEIGIIRFTKDRSQNPEHVLPLYYVGDLDRYYAGNISDPNDFECLTSPTDVGELYHQWKCPRCQRHYCITDT